MGWLFYTDGRVQTYADEKAEIARLCTSHGDTRKSLTCRLGVAQLCKGRGKPGAGGVYGGARIGAVPNR